MMAACVRTWILQLCVFTKIFLLITAQTEHMTNVAVSKQCNISSRYVENGLSNDCSAAINGNTNTTFVTEKTSQNCIYTNDNDFHPTWSVDLGQNFPVHRITIYGRETYERRMGCVQVWLDGRELYKFPCSGATNVRRDITLNPPQRGRVVSITREQYWPENLETFLNICEIQIWVCSVGWWGNDCQNQCSCEDKDNYCDPESGTCSKTNVAINKPCNISSLYVEGNSSNDCSAAINGNTGTTFVTSETSKNCIHTGEYDFHPTWSVDLGENFSVHSITIYGRENLERRMDCVQVFLDGRELYKFPCPGPTSVRTDISVNPPQRGQVVSITRDQRAYIDSAPFLNICEVQIWECSTGYWGDHCSNICDRGCKNGDCNVYNGTCECKSGWAAPGCDVCSDGHYNVSNDCINTCGRGCHDTCSRTDGTCQCRTGWQPPLCQVCSDGHYNPSNDCQNTCGEGCNNTCNRTDGVCYCRRGWDQSLCQNCVDGHYNESNDCQNTCGEGCNNTCSRTDGTCQCRSGWEYPLCKNCANGHYKMSNDCQNTCGRGCNNNTCNRTDGTCQCRPGWQSPLCQLCSKGWWGSDCQNQCRCQGKDYYCDPDHGTCSKVCSSGYWGENCTVCGAGCSNTCDSKSGACRCTNGWTGPQCTVCSLGHYNVSNDCQNTCGEGCNNTCNRTDGTCLCQTGWQPPLCQRKNTSAMMSSCDDKEALSGAGPVAGIAVGCAIVFFILGVLSGLRLRLSRSHQPSATHGSPVKTSVTSDLGTSSTMTQLAEPRCSTSSEDTADHSNNVYDELKARNDDNKSAYTSLRFQNKGKESAAPSDYINTRKILMNE